MEAHFMARTHKKKVKVVLNSGEERLCISIYEKCWHSTPYLEVIASRKMHVFSCIQRLLLAIFTTKSAR